MSQSNTLTLASEPTPVTSLGDIRTLAQSFKRSLDSDIQQKRRTPNTLRSYMETVTQFSNFLVEAGMPTLLPSITREHVDTWINHLTTIRKPNTVLNRFVSLNVFFRWCVDEGEITDNPMLKMKRPVVPETSPAVLASEDIQAILEMVKPRDRFDFVGFRDTAIIMLFSATGVRRSELSELHYDPTTDYDPNYTGFLDMENGIIHVMQKSAKGSGGKRFKSVPFDPETAKVLDRYLRARERHLHQHDKTSDALWLSSAAKKLSDDGVYEVVKCAGRLAGLGDNIHPHQLRHSFADRAMRKVRDGLMAEGDVMRLAGWKSRSMLDRYARTTQVERAHEAYTRTGMGAF